MARSTSARGSVPRKTNVGAGLAPASTKVPAVGAAGTADQQQALVASPASLGSEPSWFLRGSKWPTDSTSRRTDGAGGVQDLPAQAAVHGIVNHPNRSPAAGLDRQNGRFGLRVGEQHVHAQEQLPPCPPPPQQQRPEGAAPLDRTLGVEQAIEVLAVLEHAAGARPARGRRSWRASRWATAESGIPCRRNRSQGAIDSCRRSKCQRWTQSNGPGSSSGSLVTVTDTPMSAQRPGRISNLHRVTTGKPARDRRAPRTGPAADRLRRLAPTPNRNDHTGRRPLLPSIAARSVLGPVSQLLRRANSTRAERREAERSSKAASTASAKPAGPLPT